MNFRRIAVISLLVNVAGLLVFSTKRLASHSQPRESISMYDALNDARCGVLNMLPIDSSDIVFVGNSITEGFPLQEMFPGIHVKNRGIGGNQSRHILSRILQIASCRPKKIFLDIGVNDLRLHIPIDSILKHYDGIIDVIRAAAPSTEIYVQSVFPVGPTYKDIVDSVPAFNTELRRMCRARSITYIDIYYKLAKENLLIDPRMTFDDLHLTALGYLVWKREISSYLL